MTRRMIILTEGHTNPRTAKTASCLIRYRRDDVVAVLDSTEAGRTTQPLLGVGGDLPVVGSLDAAPQADTLVIGIAPPGGKIPPAWRAVVLAAIERGMNIVSGLHDFLGDDAQFAAAAQQHGVRIDDVRRNDEQTIATREGLRPDCLRIHTVGHDCSVGKMVVSVELTNALKAAGHDAKFIATGQTGILVEGDGCPIDRVIVDFVSGAAERQVLAHQHHDILVVEGQGSLYHPAYSAVTLGLLHGCLPHGMILCYEIGRDSPVGFPGIPLPPLAEVRRVFEEMANVMFPARVIGVAMNSRTVSADQAEQEQRRVRDELGLPVCDVIRHGPAELVEAVEHLRRKCLESVP